MKGLTRRRRAVANVARVFRPEALAVGTGESCLVANSLASEEASYILIRGHAHRDRWDAGDAEDGIQQSAVFGAQPLDFRALPGDFRFERACILTRCNPLPDCANGHHFPSVLPRRRRGAETTMSTLENCKAKGERHAALCVSVPPWQISIGDDAKRRRDARGATLRSVLGAPASRGLWDLPNRRARRDGPPAACASASHRDRRGGHRSAI